MTDIDVNKMIKEQMRKNFLSMSGLSRKMGAHQSTISSMLGRQTLQVQKLIELSKVFNYNFFKEIANLLPYEHPKLNEGDFQQEISALNEKIKLQEMEIGILRDTLKNLVGK